MIHDGMSVQVTIGLAGILFFILKLCSINLYRTLKISYLHYSQNELFKTAWNGFQFEHLAALRTIATKVQTLWHACAKTISHAGFLFVFFLSPPPPPHLSLLCIYGRKHTL
jgi:hypothetical protein